MIASAPATHITAETQVVEAAGIELYIMLAHSETSQAKGRESLGRFMRRQEGRDAPTSDATRDAQYGAVCGWGIPDHEALQRLTAIASPTLVVPGDDDPDAAHGFLFQHAAEVAADVNTFLA